MRNLILATVTSICTLASAQAQSISAEDLARRSMVRRPARSHLGMPVGQIDLMYAASPEAKRQVQPDRVLVAPARIGRTRRSRRIPDVIYLMPFFNTKDVGPVVLEVPPADDGVFNGSIDEPLAGRHRGYRAGRRR